MGVHIRDSKLVRRKEPKTNSFDLSKNVDNDLRHEIDLIIKHNELLAVHRIKTKLLLFSKCKHGNDIHENGKH